MGERRFPQPRRTANQQDLLLGAMEKVLGLTKAKNRIRKKGRVEPHSEGKEAGNGREGFTPDVGSPTFFVIRAFGSSFDSGLSLEEDFPPNTQSSQDLSHFRTSRFVC